MKHFILVLSLLFLAACTTAAPTPTPTVQGVTLPTAPPPTLPVSTAAPATPTPPPTLAPSPTPAYPIYGGPPLRRDEVGVQIHLHREDVDEIMRHLETLGVGWVKVQVSWKLFQPAADQLDEFWFAELDELVARANAADIRVMIGVAKAPEWTRPTTEMDGPPTDYARFGAFMRLLAERYRGRIHAYELWNETNLQREWNGVPLSAADFVEIMRVGAEAVRAVDPAAVIISGAPAPTGINDGVTAVDDRVYFRSMLAAGAAEVVDAFGVHPYGWGNPPGSTAANPDPIAKSHNNHPSFFFLDTLNDYRALMLAAGVERPLWATEFGWGSYDGLGATPPAGAEFMGYVDEWQQAEYLLGALELAGAREWVGPMILWNLNFGPLLGAEDIVSAYSLLRPDGSARPAYGALTTVPLQ